MAFDFNQFAKDNSYLFLAGGVLGIVQMLIFPKGLSIFGPSVGVPLGWAATIFGLVVGGYGVFLNSQSHFARANYSSVNPYYRGY